MMGSIIEKSPESRKGSKFTHIRVLDMCGNFPAVGIKKMTEIVPKIEYEKWLGNIKKLQYGL